MSSLLSTPRARLVLKALAAAAIATTAGVLVSWSPRIDPPGLESRRHDVGVARVTLLLDTPVPQVARSVDDTATVIAPLTARAKLLAQLLTTPPLRHAVAGRAGIPADRLVAVMVREGPAPRDALPTVTGQSVEAGDRRAGVLTAEVPFIPGGDSPILVLDTRAADAAGAARLAQAAADALADHLASVAAAEGVPAERRPVLRQLSPPVAAVEQRGPHPYLSLVGSCVALVLICLLAFAARRLRPPGRRRLRPDAAAGLP